MGVNACTGHKAEPLKTIDEATFPWSSLVCLPQGGPAVYRAFKGSDHRGLVSFQARICRQGSVTCSCFNPCPFVWPLHLFTRRTKMRSEPQGLRWELKVVQACSFHNILKVMDSVTGNNKLLISSQGRK